MIIDMFVFAVIQSIRMRGLNLPGITGFRGIEYSRLLHIF